MCGAGGNVNEFTVGVGLFVHSCDVRQSWRCSPQALNCSSLCEGSSCSSTATPGSKSSVKGFVTV